MRTHTSQLWIRRALALLLTAAALTPSGCTTGIAQYVHNGFKVGPNYQPPPVPITSCWIDTEDPRVRVGEPNLVDWWEVFDDPILNDLIHKAYASNLTVRQAGFQILAAREQRAIALGELLPQSQSASLQYLRVQASQNGAALGASNFAGAGLAPGAILSAFPTNAATPIAGVTTNNPGTTTTPTNPNVNAGIGGGGAPGGGATRFFSNWSTSLNLAWEIDFWGLFRRNLESASASLDQSVANYDEVVVLLLANVATQYVELRTLQKRLDLARKNIALQEPLVALYEQRYKKGIANSYPGYYQLKSNLDSTRALVPQLEIVLRQANNQLCTLLGMPVRDLLAELGDGTIPDPKDGKLRIVHIPRPKSDAVVVGIPGEFLLRRPDVRAAEQQLRIQSAQIGIAEAEMYPHIGINGSIGLAAADFNKLFDTKSGTGSIGPSLTWNILNYGRLLANVRFQNQQYLQFVANYQNTILNANLDAENALVAYLKSHEQAEHLYNSAEAASNLTSYLGKQFKAGYLPPGTQDTSAFTNQLFTATNFLVTQQDAAAQAEGNIALNLILLYRSMGGGWQIRLTDHAGSCNRPTAAGWPPSAAPVQFGVPELESELPLPRRVPEDRR